MSNEIEYKFLINKDKINLLFSLIKDTPAKEIRQGYLSYDDLVVRVRTVGDSGFITIKGQPLKSSENVLSRKEFEYQIPFDDANELLKLSKTHIDKVRYVVPYNDSLSWEIDFFKNENSDLVVAEIEVPYAGYKLVLPEWVGENISDNKNFLNHNLSRNKSKPY
jgi:adenylate cyclase